MVQRTRTPILLLTGFLGAGKTSLLARWLRAPDFAGAMVIVNELGEVGLDDRLVQHASETPLLLENGCACCTAADDLNATLERLFWDRLHRTIPPFDRVLIETTGVADPAPILASLESHPVVGERYEPAGVIVAFDARRGPVQLARHAECRSQLAQASVVVITKTDLATAQEYDAARRAVAAARPGVECLPSANGDLPAAALLTTLAAHDASARHRHAHHGQHAHDHEAHDHEAHAHRAHAHHAHDDLHAHHAADLSTAFLDLPAPLDSARLAAALAAALSAHGDDLLRLKGLARSGEHGAIEVVQAMADAPLDRRALLQPPNARPPRVGLTIIARRTPAARIAADLAAALGLPDAAPATAAAQ